jgi:hypothetical protein
MVQIAVATATRTARRCAFMVVVTGLAKSFYTCRRHDDTRKRIAVARSKPGRSRERYEGLTAAATGTPACPEPRNAPMTFRKLSDSEAELHQPPTPTFKLVSQAETQLCWRRKTINRCLEPASEANDVGRTLLFPPAEHHVNVSPSRV